MNLLPDGAGGYTGTLFFSPLSVDSFLKKSSFIYYNRAALTAAREDITAIARAEGLDAHANSIRVRF